MMAKFSFFFGVIKNCAKIENEYSGNKLKLFGMVAVATK